MVIPTDSRAVTPRIGSVPFGSENHAARGHFAHELDLGEPERVFHDATVSELVARLADGADADPLELRTREPWSRSHRYLRERGPRT